MSLKNLGPPPRPPRPVYSTTMKEALKRNLALLCANMGCVAIEATALWDDGGQMILGTAEAGACESDVARMKRYRKKVLPL